MIDRRESTKDRLVVTVSDVDGTKTYNLNKIIKKAIIYSIIIIITIISVSFWTISYLDKEVLALNIQADKIRAEGDKVRAQSNELAAQNKVYSLQIKDKIKDIEELGDTIRDIEDIIGLKNNDEVSLINRATLAKLTSTQKSFMFHIIPNGNPLKEYKITAKFGWRIHPITKKKKYHNGIDLRAKRRTPVAVTADGVVRYVQDKNKGNYGRMIIVAHNYGFETVYSHLRYTHVKVGDVVRKGQVIAKSGNSGLSSGPHLHYEVRYASKVLNPKSFIEWSIKNYENIFEKQRRVQWESLVKMINSQKLAQQ